MVGQRLRRRAALALGHQHPRLPDRPGQPGPGRLRGDHGVRRCASREHLDARLPRTAGARDPFPGADGLWGALLNPRSGSAGGGLFASRNLASSNPTQGNTNGASGQDPSLLKGKSLGPYLEVKAESDIGAVTGFEADYTPITARSGEINDFDAAPKCILDYFGKPILYYRRGYLNGDPKRLDRRWTLADVVALRPLVFGLGEAVDAVRDGAGDTSAPRAGLSAECALLSFGPDTRWNPTVRADPAGYNEDNIVRFGP